MRRHLPPVFVSVLGLWTLLPASAPFAGETTRVSVDSAGNQGNDLSQVPAISADGRFVAFQSWARNLVAGDTNANSDVFIHDRVTGMTELASVNSADSQGNFASFAPSISADARFVAFASFASNLVPGDTLGADIFVHDRLTGLTEQVSVHNANNPGNFNSEETSISADGRFVAFSSGASDLVSGDTNGVRDVFLRDRGSGTTTRVSVDSDRNQGNAAGVHPSISADGRFVAFHSEATNLVSGDTNGTSDVFVHDRVNGTTRRVSVDSAGNQLDLGSGNPSLSGDGRFVAFFTSPGNSVFVHDRTSGTTTQASGGFDPAISADGRFVASWSPFALFVHDRATGMTELVSVDSGARAPSISADGRFVEFHSGASNLVSSDTNGASDVFVHDRGPQEPSDLPDLPAPSGDNRLVRLGNLPINPDLPTVVLTHGWQRSSEWPIDLDTIWTGGAPGQAAELVARAYPDPAAINVLQFFWKGAFTKDSCPLRLGLCPSRARENFAAAAEYLAGQLEDRLGLDYHAQIHFIGHSFGSMVNAEAAQRFLSIAKSIDMVQFTILDYPADFEDDQFQECKESDTAGTTPIWCHTSAFYFQESLGDVAAEFAERGRPFLVDNYFSRDDLGQGEVISFEGGRVHNYQELNEPNDVGNLLFNDEPQNNHSGVHQWYRWTMDPNGLDGETYCEGQTFINPALLDESLNPCTAGWRWAISNPNPTSEFGAPNGPSVGFIERVLSGIFTRSQRCSQLVGPAFAMDASCTEGSDALIAYEVEIPAGTEFISFEWRFGNRGDGDYAAVFIDEEPIWVMLGTSAFSDEFQSSGPVPIGDLEGSHELLVVLYGVNQANAGFTIRNFETIGVESLTLGAQKDAFIHFGAPNLNEGANPKVAVQVPLRQRAVVGFDETAITDFVNDHGLSKATLSLTIADVGGIGGAGDRSISAHPLLVDFAEGNGKSGGLPPSSSVRGDGPGVTWNCAVDEAIGNPLRNCAKRWDGGNFGPATAPSIVHSNGMTGEVEWDVTDDVLDGASGWLIKKSDELRLGRARYHSKEGAIDAGNVDLAPRLILER